MPGLGERIAEQARQWVGTPFAHAGRERGLGVDCVGLVLGVARELGLTDYENRRYSRQVDPQTLRAEIERFCERMPDGAEPQPGDLLLLLVHEVPTHLAVMGLAGTMIHACEWAPGRGRVCEERFDPSWRARLAAVYRWREGP